MKECLTMCVIRKSQVHVFAVMNVVMITPTRDNISPFQL